jgi:hypothetical protein
MFEVALYYQDNLITIISVGHPCLIDFIKKIPREYKIQIIDYKSVVSD